MVVASGLMVKGRIAVAAATMEHASVITNVVVKVKKSAETTISTFATLIVTAADTGKNTRNANGDVRHRPTSANRHQY